MSGITVKTRKVTRDKLARLTKGNHELVVLLENLSEDVTNTLPDMSAIALDTAQRALQIAAQAMLLAGEVGGDDGGGGGAPGQAGLPGADGATGPAGPVGFGLDGEDGQDGMPIPGPQGATGPQGPTGATGPAGSVIMLTVDDGTDGEQGPPGLPGPAGATGATGPAGAIGPGVFLEAEAGEEGPQGPPGPAGSIGATGPAGSNGATGAQGPMGPVILPDYDSWDNEPMMMPPAKIGLRYLRQPTAPASASQAIAAATLTLITGTSLAPNGFYVGQTFRWTVIGNSAAAGTAANTITVRMGTANSTADAAVASFTTSVGTAAVSQFRIDICLTVLTLGASATAAAQCVIWNSAATGFVNIGTSVLAGSMSAFNSTTAAQFVHVDITTGAAKTATITQAWGEVVAPANDQALYFD